MARPAQTRGTRMPAGTKIQKVDTEIMDENEPMKIGEANSMRKRVLAICDTIGASYLELGKYLDTIAKRQVEGGKPIYKLWGFKSFDEYCERELGFRERKANHLANIFRKTIEGPLPKDAVEKTDWSKMAMVAPLVDKGVITDDNAEKWMKKIEGKSFEEVRTMTKSAIDKSKEKASKSGKTKTAPEEIHILRVPLFKDQWKNAQIALNKAQTMTDSDKLPWQMDCIFLSFNSETFTSKEQALDEICRRAERVFGVKILALNASDESQVVFGDRVMKLLKAAEQKGKKK
jgi:hypothetical protein